MSSITEQIAAIVNKGKTDKCSKCNKDAEVGVHVLEDGDFTTKNYCETCWTNEKRKR